MSKEFERQRAIGQQVIATELAKHVGLAAEGQSIAHIAKIQADGRAASAKAEAEREAKSAKYWSDRALKAENALEMKEALLKEWMHSNEAFKRLARKYGKKLGVSDEQRQNDLDDEVIAVAEEKPEFANTNNLKAAKEARGMK